MSLRIGNEIEVVVQGIGTFGEGLARQNDSEIFIPKTMPGDRVKIKIVENKKNRFRAEVIEILEASSHRQEPKCSHFNECGGCDFQHITYEEQIAWKERITKHWIRRSPLEPQLSKIKMDTIESPSEFHYRHRVRFQVKDKKLHFFKPQSSKLLELNECPVLVEGFFDSLKKEAEQMADQKDWGRSFETQYDIDGHTIQFGDESFTQGNLEVNALIWERIKEDILNLPEKRKALDLFCGIGNFSIPLTDHFKEVVAVESFAPAIEWAKKNSQKVQWHCEESLQFLAGLKNEHKFFDLIVLDPPRQGAYQEVQAAAQLFTPCIIYVSCNIESLIRDLTFLTKKARYKITRWTVADLFPQTHHIESIVTLRL